MLFTRLLFINQPQIGELICELHLETGLIREQFAAHLGLTYSSINRWGKGHSKLSLLIMRRLMSC